MTTTKAVETMTRAEFAAHLAARAARKEAARARKVAKFAAENAANPEAVMTPAQILSMLEGC